MPTPESVINAPPPRRGIPLGVKIAYSAFILLHIYLEITVFGARDLLWICDTAAVLTAIGLWMESSLLLSMQLVGTLVPMLLWSADLLCRLFTGHFLLGMCGYLFDPHDPLINRAASMFHLWLPPLLVWTVWRLGYDRRAWVYQFVFLAGFFLFCRLVSLPPPEHYFGEPVNINLVFGGFSHPQTHVSAAMYLALLWLTSSICIMLPTHVFLCMVLSEPGVSYRSKKAAFKVMVMPT